MVLDFPYLKSNAKIDKWKWVYLIENKENIVSNPNLLNEKIANSDVLQTYGLKKLPKSLPCNKKCNLNPWCLANLMKENQCLVGQLTEQLRDMSEPIGLQNTANTCWVNSALQALFHIYQFRNAINTIPGFKGEESLNSLEFLLQAMFVEMELHKNKALACSMDSVFEKLSVFVTKEIMQKDQDFEVLKCVSEFLENTIDSLLGNPRTGPQFSSIFRTTIYRVAKWKCSACGKEHILQLAPDTCYTMAAYVSGDECPLGQCILDLQTETQTGVSLVCEEGGCGATVKVDRVVTPLILSLPSLLIIRNNSLIDNEIKRRLHVVYPESLDLTSFVCTKESAVYSLRAVIYHHGHWIKHFSAHVKLENGKWFNFNDEKVSALVKRSGNCIPLEIHKDYFSIANVANKYKNQSKLRVSRGAFIWIYERDTSLKEKILLQPPNDVVEYVLTKQKNKQVVDGYTVEKIKKKRENLFKKLAVENVNEEVCLVSRSILSSWLRSSDIKFIPQPSTLAEGMCEHIKFDPLKANSFRCIKKSQVDSLLNSECGITSDNKIPLVFSLEDGFCKLCVTKHAHHIIFREYLKELNKIIKKESSKEQKIGTTFVGAVTMANWMSLAIIVYMKDTGLDEVDRNIEDDSDSNGKNHLAEDSIEEEPKNPSENSVSPASSVTNGEMAEFNSTGLSKENGKDNDEDKFSYFNEDVVCPHNMLNPVAFGFWVPDYLEKKMKKFCGCMIHPSTLQTEFTSCSICKENREKTLEICTKGKFERKQLYYMFVERRRPRLGKDSNDNLFLLSKEFFSEWKTFVRQCVKEEEDISRPKSINNSHLLCKHSQLLYSCTPKSSLFDFALVLWEEEWKALSEWYPFDCCLQIRFTEDGHCIPGVGVCEEGCVEEEAARIFEDQFTFEYELINIRQVNSVTDVPSSSNNSDFTMDRDDNSLPNKKPRLAAQKDVLSSSSSRAASQKLVRASKTFSSSDTIREVQNFIAERTKIWPFLQTLWLSGGKEHGPEPFLLSEENRSMTLHALRIKPGDTIYFRAAMEDMEKAAGDGETEYNEIE